MSSNATYRPPAAAIPSTVSAVVTTVQVFPDNLRSTVAVPLAALCPLPGSGALEQKKFFVRASGKVVTGTAANVKVGMYAHATNTNLTAASYTKIAESTARAQNSASAPWWIECELVFDSTSGKLHGTFRAMVNNNLDSFTAVSNVVASISAGAGSTDPAIQFAVALDFSASNAANIGTLTDFTLEG